MKLPIYKKFKKGGVRLGNRHKACEVWYYALFWYAYHLSQEERVEFT